MKPRSSSPCVFCVLVLVLAVSVPAAADPPPGYYDPAIGLTGQALKNALHGIIDDHTRYPYTSGSTDTWDILEDAEEDPSNTANVLTVYKNASYLKSDHSQGSGWNREHSWPNSYGFSNDGSCNYPFTDCHQLFPADWSYNTSRGNRVYDECVSGCTTYAVDGSSDVNRGMGAGNTGAWETWGGRRGDVARAMFYLAVRYEGGNHGLTGCAEPDLILTDNRSLIVSSTQMNFSPAYMGILSTLLQWHQDDPVDDHERSRNDVIFSYQGNRNPFIDHPEWVCEIWSCSGDMVPPAMPTGLMATGGDCSLTLDWDDNTEPDLVGYNVYRDGGEGYVLLNQATVTSSDYVDSTAQNLAIYAYQVTAIDISGNESVGSDPVVDGPTGTTPCAGGGGLAWINEFHYDNSGTDTGEGIEIAGPAGLNLSGWSLVGYNGNGGAQYDTVALSGTLADQENGFGTAFFSFTGLQNGGPDGMALVDNGQNVIQFLSYEGAFIAVGGPANGMMSEDVGVTESGGTPIGFSLQLGGTGSSYSDFMWQTQLANTNNNPNTNQMFVATNGVNCRAGNVGEDAALSPERVLCVNGETGLGPDRIVRVSETEDLELFLDAGTNGPAAPNYAVWGWDQEPTTEPATELPFNLGTMCFSPLNSNCMPCPIYSAKNVPGRCNAVLCETPEATGATAPAIILVLPAGTYSEGDRIWFQGVAKDLSDTSGRRFSVTNGIEVLFVQ